MRWPWSRNPERDIHAMNKDEMQQITEPAHEEIRRSQDRVERIDRILKEARMAEIVVKKARQQR